MDPLILANVACFGWALYETTRKMLWSDYPRKPLRFVASFVSFYFFVIYLLAMVGVIPDIEVRLFLRWFNVVVALYMILEARHG